MFVVYKSFFSSSFVYSTAAWQIQHTMYVYQSSYIYRIGWLAGVAVHVGFLFFPFLILIQLLKDAKKSLCCSLHCVSKRSPHCTLRYKLQGPAWTPKRVENVTPTQVRAVVKAAVSIKVFN